MSNMAAYRDGLSGNSYTRETFIAKFESDSSTKDFMWEKLKGLDLSGLNLTRGGGFGIELRGADLSNSDFSHSLLPSAHFAEAVLRNVNFYACDLRGAIFVESDIRGADFSSAKLSSAGFYRARYDRNTVFPPLFNVEKHDMVLA